MHKELSSKIISQKYLPRKILGLFLLDISFVSKYPKTEFFYNAIIAMCEVIEAEVENDGAKKAKSISDLANRDLKILKTKTDKNIDQYTKEVLDKKTAENLENYLNEGWRFLQINKRTNETVKMPKHLNIAFAMMDVKSIARRVYNRRSSTGKPDNSQEMDVLVMMIDIGVDSVINNYINAWTHVKSDGHEKIEALNEEFISALEYMLILFNKIDGAYSLHSFRNLPSATNEVLTKWFEKIHMTEWF